MSTRFEQTSPSSREGRYGASPSSMLRQLVSWTVPLGVGSLLALLATLALVPVPRIEDPTSLVLLDRDGELLGASIASDEQWRFPPIESVPERLELAIVHFEDKRFHRHNGVDPLALARAAIDNLRERRVVSGASTISMQVVRLARKGRPRTLREKALEALLATRLEVSLNKDQILAMYVSHAPYGGNVVGIEAASWRYFERPLEELSWAEAALLAVLPNSPGLIHPGRNRERLRARRDRLLRELMRAGMLDEETLELSSLEDLPASPRPFPQLAPHLMARYLAGREGHRSSRESKVRTTLDRGLQARASEVASRHRSRMEMNRVFNAAALILETETGEVLAYVGNAADPRRDEDAPHVDCVRARRSPGSTLKPMLYAAMLQEGDLAPSTLVMDVPTRFGGFAPENFDRTYVGALPARTALARSLNVPAARLLAEYGVDRFAALLQSLGMSTIDKPASHYGLSLILGGSEATLWDLTGIYAGLGRAASGMGQGSFFSPIVEQREGMPLAARGPVPIEAGPAFLTLEALLEVERPGPDANWRRFASSRQIAWKTGTSWGHRDAWALGVSRRYTVGVWVGNANGGGRPGLTGHFAAAPLLMELFALLPSDEEGLHPPKGSLTTIEVCANSGQRRGPNCARTRTERVPPSGTRLPACQYCRTIHCDSTCGHRVHTGCESPDRIRSEPRFVLPPSMEWFFASGNPSYARLPPWRPDCREAVRGHGPSPLAMVHPRAEARVFIPRELDGRRGRAVFTAAHREPGTTVHWHLGNQYLGSTRDLHQMELAPEAGPHVVTLVDENGETLSHPFSVSH